VDMLRADALQIHLNVMQELIMPEGDRDFTGRLERIHDIVQQVGVPVIVKEVGFGMAHESAAALVQAGVKVLDVGGGGGTNFAAIENARRNDPMEWLNDWGCTTSIALLEALHGVGAAGKIADSEVAIIGSGGIRSGLEVCKALAIGASAVGIAGAFLQTVRHEGTAALINQIAQMHHELKLVMTALGSRTIPELWNTPVVIAGETAHWCKARGVDIRRYADRSGLIKTI
jgi:isopentenyl-diphosphate delta-isomerase